MRLHSSKTHDERPSPEPPRPVGLTRRVLVTLGAAALTQACAHPSTRHAPAPAAHPSASELPGDSHQQPPPSRPLEPTKIEGWKPVPLARPVPDRCPVIDGEVQYHGGPQHYVPCNDNNIGLTIDDGPDPTWTPRVLKLLARYHVTATFCLIGRSAAAFPNLVAAIADAGHEVANHTWTHPLPFTGLSAGRLRDEIHRTSDVLARLTTIPPVYFRAPGGQWNTSILREVKSAGLRPLDWSVDPRDWSRPGVPHIVNTILRLTRPGAIILEHDGGGNRAQTVEALSIALPRLIDAGYTFVTPNGNA